jgi:group I intron endonuclease
MRKGYIYVIVNNINGKYYYGKTFNVQKRWKHHIKNAAFKINRRLYDAMNCYGYNNFSYHIITEILEPKETITKKLNDLETYFIKISDSQNPLFGYNMTDGGDGGDTLTNNPNRKNIIEKRRISNTGKKRTPEFCIKISKIAKNVSPEIRKRGGINSAKSKKNRIIEYGYTEKELIAQKKNTQTLINYNKSEEGRKRASLQFKGKKKAPFSEQHRKNIGKASKGRKIPGKKLNILNITYESLHDASRKLNIPIMTIKYRLVSQQSFKDWYYL